MQMKKYVLISIAVALAAGTAKAATMSSSLTAPTIDGEDIANYGTVTGSDKWFYEDSGAGAVKGQTFTTGSSPLVFKAITYQGQKAEPTKTYAIRVGTVSGSTFTQIYSETATQTFTWNASEYMTWTFAAPVLLLPNTVYGIDVGMTGSTSAWQTGIPYINFTANVYAGGVQYSSGTLGVGTSSLSLTGNDRIFHLDLEKAPTAPTGLKAISGPATGSVRLDWTAVSNATGYNVKRSLTNSGYVTIGATALTSYNDFTVRFLTNYYYVVSSTNSLIESTNSAAVFIKLPVPGTVITIH